MATGQKVPRNPGSGATRKTTILALTTLYAAILAAILAGFFYAPARAANAATVRANTPRLMFYYVGPQSEQVEERTRRGVCGPVDTFQLPG